MYLLGLSFYYHDAAAALIHDGKIIAAAEEERFSRIKHDHRFPTNAVAFCLQQAELDIGDVDFVVFYEKPGIKFDRVLGTLAKSYPDSQSLFKKVMGNWGKEKFWVSETIQSRLKIPRKKILFSEHHLSHVAHAYYLSPFQEAATLTIDGVGEWITTSIGSASGVVLERHSATIFPHSIGLL